MCGICGAVDLGGGPVREEELRPMTAALRLRGPDDEGFFLDAPSGAAGLGHRRLSIIDLSGGHQPLASEDGQVQVVHNGEIYNFVELRRELEALGHRFRTRSDSETIVHGYEQWGDDVVPRLDGMFSLAVWDRRRRRLLLARDRFGKKPLAWFKAGGRFVFSSTLTSLLQHPASPRAIDRLALQRYLALEFVPAPQTILAGVQKLEPGSLVTVEADGHVQRRRYWRLEVRGRMRLAGPEEAEEELRRRLREAVRRRLVADVPVGIFLSGGVDSSSVAAMAVELGAGRIRTFSIGFSDPAWDESGYARAVARRLGTEHVEERLEPATLLELVPHVGQILDEPMADASIVPTYLLSRLARRHVTVALGGDGGDELFAGYPTYVAHRLTDLARPVLRPSLLGLAARVVRALPVGRGPLSLDFKLKKTLDGLGWPDEVRNYLWMGAFRPDEVAEVLGTAVAAEELLAPIAATYREAPGGEHLERVLYQDVRLYLAHQILMKVDRASMANSLEVRAPLLDTELATFVAGLPLEAKLRGLRGKAILKRAMAGLLPAEILERPKKGFGIPMGEWLRGPLAGMARELLLGADGLAGAGLVDGRVVGRLLDEHQQGRVDHRKRLWSLLVLELWRREHRVSGLA